MRELNRRGRTDLLVVDDLEQGHKYRNLADLVIQDYMDRSEFRTRIESGQMRGSIEAILHNGACTDTMEHGWPPDAGPQFRRFEGHPGFRNLQAHPPRLRLQRRDLWPEPGVRGRSRNECPLNLYGWSKLVFDQHVRSRIAEAESTLVGLRCFNVYGPREQHKGRMMSVLHQLLAQLRSEGVCRLFEGTDGFAHGEQVRDFIFVDDIVDILLFFARKAPSGRASTTPGPAKPTASTPSRTLIHLLGQGRIDYIPFPENLRGHYQSYTQADIRALQAAGYDRPFTPLETGIQKTLMAMGD